MTPHYVSGPDTNYNGTDSFTFVTNDGTVNSAPATVTITITPTNDPPTADDQSVGTPEDTAVSITLTGNDIDGDALTFTVTTNPANGTLTGTAPNLTYTPDANYNGTDSFSFVTNDGTVNSTPATIDVTITPVNDAPTADDQSVAVAEDDTSAITLTGIDVDGDSITYTVTSGPANGTLGPATQAALDKLAKKR